MTISRTPSKETVMLPSLAELYRIRQLVLYPDRDISFVELPGDENALHWGWCVDDKLVSVVSLFERDNELQFRKFATLPGEQRKGYGGKLLEKVFAYAQEKGLKCVWCNARMNATEWYKRHGMSSIGDTWTNNGITYTKMIKQL